MDVNKELLEFIEKSPSVYHVAVNMAFMLKKAGFKQLKETSSWDLAPGGKFFVVRNNSSIIAFTVGERTGSFYFKIAASHSDSPTFMVKEVPELEGPGEYLRLNVEPYGGMIDYSWFDRPLGLAGRVYIREGNAIRNRLIATGRDVCLIPSQSIHFNRDVNEGVEFNRQIDLCPLFSKGTFKKGALNQLIADSLNISTDQIISKNLFLVNRQQGTIWGAANEFISSPKLDDLQCAFTSLKGFISASEKPISDGCINIFACLDNEEVGSGTKQGAMSTFLKDVLYRICICRRAMAEEYHMAVAKSFMVSCDNAQAVHPNHPEKYDLNNAPEMNKGIVIKENAAQKYMTDAFSRGVFRMLCEKAGVPWQTYSNRSDQPGGSTLGNISTAQVSMNGVDVGLPQIAMHSAYETAGAHDNADAVKLFETFYQSRINIEGPDKVEIE